MTNSKSTSEYKIWKGIKQRCLNPNSPAFHNYGGRGISICDEWKNSFFAFLTYIGQRPSPKHSVGRIDNNGNYEPGNVRWETQSQQARNRRNNRFIHFDGKTQCLEDWAVQFHLSSRSLLCRLQYGWTMSQALGLIPRPVRFSTKGTYINDNSWK